MPNSVDMVITDLPYMNSTHSWDMEIPLPAMWAALKRVVRPGGAMVFTAAQPFTTRLISSNLQGFRHALVWNKVMPVGFLNANKFPLRVHEDILVFGDRIKTYNPIMVERGKPRNKGSERKSSEAQFYGHVKDPSNTFNNLYYPTSIITVSNSVNKDKIHPTQKPVELFEYLIRTYSNPGDLVVDLCMGSGTTAIASINVGRNFVGWENDAKFYAACIDRVHAHIQKLNNTDYYDTP